MTSIAQSVVNVIAPALTITQLTPPAPAEGMPTDLQFLATFTDTNTDFDLSNLSATVAWGDGQTDTYTGAGGGIVENADGSFSVVGSHTYQPVEQYLIFGVGGQTIAFEQSNVPRR
jgi:hypothetical protein